MSSALHEQPYLESGRWMSRQIRCAMDPDEPRLIEHYLAEGRYLACCTATSPWIIAETSVRLLLDTAADIALPWHWRSYGLDQAWQPLRELERLSQCLKRWQRYPRQLATCELQPLNPS
jgi:hypothetical protein